MPVAAEVGSLGGHHHHMPDARCDVSLAARAEIGLRRLVGLDTSHFDDVRILRWHGAASVAGYELWRSAEKGPRQKPYAYQQRTDDQEVVGVGAAVLPVRVESHDDQYRRRMSEPHTPVEFETIRVEREDGIVTVTLDRPRVKNAINGSMWNELLATFRSINGRSEDRVVVITGADGEFCSGADLSAVGDDRHSMALMGHIGDVCMALHRLPQPTIARVDGVAAGAGLNMALACDLIAASDRSRFSEIFSRRGLSVDFGGSWALPRLIGLHRAKELVLLADIIDAAEAERLGLVNRVLPVDQLDQLVGDWAHRLAAGPPIALAASKRMLNDGLSRTLEAALEDEGRSQAINFATADTMEAVTAFLQKRDPHFEGR